MYLEATGDPSRQEDVLYRMQVEAAATFYVSLLNIHLNLLNFMGKCLLKVNYLKLRTDNNDCQEAIF